MNGIGLDQSQVADAINRKYQGMSQRERNQKMAQAQSGGASPFQQTFSSELAQAQQPTEFWGAGRKVAENQLPDLSAANLVSPLSKLGGDYYYYGDNDPSKAQWGTDGYTTANLGQGKYNILGKDGNVLGTGYKSLQDTLNEMGYGHKSTGNETRDWETLGQLLNYGGINASTNKHSLGGNLISDPIKGLQTLYGSTPLISNGKIYGYKSDFGVNPVTDQWSTSSSSTSGGPFNKKRTTTWDVGNVGVGRELVDPSWWNANTVGIGNNPSSRYIASQLAEKNPGWLNADYLNQNTGSNTSKVGLLGSIFSWLDPMLDKLDPGHNTVQKLTTGSSDTEGQMPYFQKIAPMILNLFTSGVGGSLLGAADAASLGNTGAALGNLAGAAIGANGIDTGYGSLANSVASGAASSAIGSLASGGDAKGTLLAALFGGLGGGAGVGVGNLTKDLGTGLSGFLSGAAQGAVSRLHDPEHILESALSSGAGKGLAGLMNQNVTDTQQRKENISTAKTATDLAKLFYKAKK